MLYAQFKMYGVKDVIKYLNTFERGMKRLQASKALVYSRRPYAWGMEHGRFRTISRRPRKAGAARFMRYAYREILQSGRRDISEGLEKVRYPGPWILKRLALWHRRMARTRTPVLTGKLRRSVRVELRGPFRNSR